MDKQPAKNGKGAPKRRVSALQKVAGPIPAGSDVGSSLDDFIASANQTLTDTDAFKLTSDITGETKAVREKKAKEESAAIEAAAAQAAAEAARAAAEEAARKIVAEVTRKSAQQMARLEAKLAEAEARASSAEQRVRPPRTPSAPLPVVALDEGPDFAEGSYSKPFGRLDADLIRRRRWVALKIGLVATGAAVVAGGVFLIGNGRLWNKDSETPATASVVAAKSEPAPAAAPAREAAAPAPAVSALPAAEPVEAKPAAVEAAPAPTVEAAPAPTVEAAPAPTVEPLPPPAPAAGQPPAPVVSALAPTTPTVSPLDGGADAASAHAPAPKSSKKKKARAGKPRSKPSKKSGSSGGIVDPFAQ